MKQFKAKHHPSDPPAVSHLITQHNALCDYLEEREGEKTNNPLAQRDPAPIWDLTDRNHNLPDKITQFTPKLSESGDTREVLYTPYHVSTACSELMAKVNELIDYLAEREAQPTYTTSGLAQSDPIVIKQTITLPKPEWWEREDTMLAEWRAFREGYEACSKASGILFKLED